MQDYYRRLLARAQRAFGDKSPEVVIQKTRAIIGPHRIPDTQAAAKEAMRKIDANERPTANELMALEYVIRVMRPAPLVIEGDLDPLEQATPDLHPRQRVEQWDQFRTAVKPWLRSIGRIDHPQRGHIGTGFLVAEGILATNRHVVDDLSAGAGVLPPGAFVRFHSELGGTEPPQTRGELIEVMAFHPTLDIALIRVKSATSRPALELDPQTKIEDGHPIAVIGFPAKSEISNPLFGDAIFKSKFGVKRGAIGEIMEPLAPHLYHDCTTLNGNSGSPIFSLTSQRVIGIHRSGWFCYRNEGVLAPEIAVVLSQI